jgi:hypothetical protein
MLAFDYHVLNSPVIILRVQCVAVNDDLLRGMFLRLNPGIQVIYQVHYGLLERM